MADEILTIETPEHVELQFALASSAIALLPARLTTHCKYWRSQLVSILSYNISDGARRLGSRVAQRSEEEICGCWR
jgi:hypothetical protein